MRTLQPQQANKTQQTIAALQVTACLLVALLLVAASHADASGGGRKLAQSNGRQWPSDKCISWGDPQLKMGEKNKDGKEIDTHPHDYCEKKGGVKVCCYDGKCGGITCARGNPAACCPEKP